MHPDYPTVPAHIADCAIHEGTAVAGEGTFFLDEFSAKARGNKEQVQVVAAPHRDRTLSPIWWVKNGVYDRTPVDV
jgi:hypothetical protein